MGTEIRLEDLFSIPTIGSLIDELNEATTIKFDIVDDIPAFDMEIPSLEIDAKLLPEKPDGVLIDPVELVKGLVEDVGEDEDSAIEMVEKWIREGVLTVVKVKKH